MTRAEGITKEDNQMRFAVSVLEARPPRAKTRTRAGESVRALERYELNLSGSQLLVGFLSASCAVGLMLWAVLKLWLAGR
jgi:hypothetical protein